MSLATISSLTLILQGSQVDASIGTTTRLAAQTLFAGKATTLANLSALVAPFDNAVIPFWQSAGYARPFDMGDVTAAGVS